ncbi:hypothetical protein K450DRAFT_223270 [Umbelopsis ramanniana AG]|uniref:Citrate transporter-like domain-containing protein n=1 Tax=Umbelopsis ramanniana AG TaxID=1314678 RepID=A0AAD5EHB7_UMBRA|nr:uncharacterized protein K450DRAFT_223270 [Umbelopsis ramanniana AG]KAI8583362.1 hypothetical protein K450DRAFT_223270 [Umbelopsis ramanniana AG]
MADNDTLNAFSWVALATFLVVIVFVVFPVRIKLGACGKPNWRITLDIATAPILGIIFLLATTTIKPYVVLRGFLGSAGIQPWGVMILFYSLAYICISLDLTGLFQFCAFWISRRAGSNGHTVFTAFFILTTVMSALTSNDVVILTGTVFLSYFTRVSDIHPTAFLMSEFTTANIASMALYIGNPTNVVVSQAYNIGFLEYSAWMLLPTVICTILAYITMRILFRNPKYIPKTILSPDADPKSVLVDPFGAVFGVVLLGCCLGTLIGTSFAGVEVWQITLPFSVVMFVRDVVHDVGGGKIILQWAKSGRQRAPPSTNETVDHISSSRSIGSQTTDGIPLEQVATQSPLPPALSTSVSIASSRSIVRTNAPSIRSENSSKAEKSHRFRDRFPTLYDIGTRMPWKILPFALGMFILVEALSDLGWTAIFAIALARITPNYYAAVFSVTFITLMACQLLNNLPMTILFTRIMQHPNFYQAANVTPQVLKGCIFSLVVGSNLGACFTLVGSLAGIMFDHILKTKGIYVLQYFQFLKWNLVIMPVLATGACCVLIGELWYAFR